jgi:phospholipase A1
VRSGAAFVCAALLCAGAAVAQTVNCVDIDDDRERLACYDRVNGRLPAPATRAAAQPLPTQEQLIRREHLGATLSERWELAPGSSLGTFLPRPYKPTYVLPATVSDAVNRSPRSPAPDHSVTSPLDLDPAEFKFQISFKAKLVEGLLGTPANLWVGYTQSSRWQVYNGPQSRPFRETNYEPELILAWPTNLQLFGWNGRLASVALNHQSNGRPLPLSRSWNRVVGEFALDRDDWMLSLRPWWRIPERRDDDDNPDISNFVGRGEVLLSRRWYGHVFTVQLRHSLRFGEPSRGSLQFDWAFPVVGNVKGYLQFFGGYGESLIDYNVRQNKLGIGASVVEWM